MRPGERDDLLIRMDERVKALKDGEEGDIPEIKSHLKAINGHLDDHSKRITEGEGERKRIEQKIEERTISKVSKKAVACYGGGTIVVVSTLVLAIGQIAGWW